jgi:membrane-associated phospholipid phosphatase
MPFPGSPRGQPKFHSVVATGSMLTPLTGGVCYLSGAAASNPELKGLGSALLQAQVLTSLTIGVLKGFTGRPHPDPNSGADMRKLSRSFRFGFLRGGLFWGWPSGHTASTTALVSTLTAFYPEETWLKIGGAALMGYTIVGVSAVGGGRMHWFSDAVAAAFMTYAIGHTVGDYYHRQVFHQGTSMRLSKVRISAESLPAFPIVRIVYAF